MSAGRNCEAGSAQKRQCGHFVNRAPAARAAILPAVSTTLHRQFRLRNRPAGTLALIFGLMLPTVALPQAAVRSQTDAEQSDHPARVEFLTGQPFQDALDRPVSLVWQDQAIRDGLRRLMAAQRVSILLDRRIDPGRTLSLQLRNVPLRELLERVAAECRAQAVVVDSVVYLGPPSTAARLRTVMEMQSVALRNESLVPARRSQELLRRSTREWPDLETPAAIINDIAKQYGLRLTPDASIPHDLWAGATLPSLTADQQLLLVLGQFGLSFEWQENGQAIRVVPMPENPRTQREFQVRTGSPADALAKLKAAFPEADITSAGRRLRAIGTVEQLEAMEQTINPSRTVARSTPKPSGQTVFSFEVRSAPLSAVMRRLSEQAGFEFDYDVEQLRAAGISLETKLDLKLQNASTDEMLHGLFDRFNIVFEVEGSRVKLRPKTKTGTP